MGLPFGVQPCGSSPTKPSASQPFPSSARMNRQHAPAQAFIPDCKADLPMGIGGQTRIHTHMHCHVSRGMGLKLVSEEFPQASCKPPPVSRYSSKCRSKEYRMATGTSCFVGGFPVVSPLRQPQKRPPQTASLSEDCAASRRQPQTAKLAAPPTAKLAAHKQRSRQTGGQENKRANKQTNKSASRRGSKAKQSKAKQSKAKQSKAKQIKHKNNSKNNQPSNHANHQPTDRPTDRPTDKQTTTQTTQNKTKPNKHTNHKSTPHKTHTLNKV